ncbi:MAG: SPOR domain-containing protein [Prolixibacteraceae bacterium]|jgi:cell division septation protein DedD|nr:SPOR domain-containing protein [Prolixibacteraceae bacterium]
MNLSSYLSELLKTNDCVIIPDLGGFIANYQTSGYDIQGDQFSPPSKELIFSSKLKKNDGLVVNYVAEKEGVGYLEARKIVSEFVSECQSRLENGERVEFSQVGSIYFDKNENILFDSLPKVNLRVDAFGLDSFHFPPLVNKFSQAPKPAFRDKEPEPQKRLHPVVKYALVGLPILALLYFVPYKGIFNRGDSAKQTSSNNASLALSDSPVALPGVKSEPLMVSSQSKIETKTSEIEVKDGFDSSEPKTFLDHAPVASVVPESKASVSQNSVVQKTAGGKFHVVGGCFKIRENADNLAEKLIKQGYHAEVSNLGKSFFRVSVESYLTRTEAVQSLAKILEADPETGYWLMVDK